jgi:TrmH family RNA methyltransferase
MAILSSNLSKFIKSLQLKKFRTEQNCFFVEGKVNVLEALSSNFVIKHLLITLDNYESVKDIVKNDAEIIVVKESDLEKVGTYQSNNFGLAVLEIPQSKNAEFDPETWSLAFDNINDPGNFGTIIRTADWFGVKNIYCSKDSVDFYNPKVINSTKGSFARVNIHYVDLEDFLKNKNLVSAEMDGKNYREFDWKGGGILLMGNESHGVRKELSELCKAKLTIPRKGKAESLNVAVATALFCAEIGKSLK